MNRIVLAVIATLVAFIGPSSRAAEPKEDARPQAASVSEPRSQTLKGFTYFYVATRANFQNIGDKAKALIPDLEKAALEAHANRIGALVFIYHGVTEDPAKDFDLEIGISIAEKVTAGGEFKVREVSEYPCMSVLYSGPLSQLSSAYEKLFPAAMSGAAKPTGESREMYLYFEAPDSPNNVVHISVGLK